MTLASSGSESEEVAQSGGPVATYAVPPPREVGELIYVFRRDLVHLRTAIDAQQQTPSPAFATAAWTSFGVTLTSAVGLIALYGTPGHPTGWAALLLWCLTAASAAATAACGIAARYFRATAAGLRRAILEELGRLEYGASSASDESVVRVPEIEGTDDDVTT
jgi:hypothetical protein